MVRTCDKLAKKKVSATLCTPLCTPVAPSPALIEFILDFVFTQIFYINPYIFIQVKKEIFSFIFKKLEEKKQQQTAF